MKKLIFVLIFMFLDLVIVISGLTLTIISYLVDYDLSYTLALIGNLGIGSAIGTLLTILTISFLSEALK